MIKVEDFYESLKGQEVDFYAGVSDSLLKDICGYITDINKENHVITANEGNAIALAAGHYLASGKTPLVYMQNSGLGNCINPLTSLTDNEVYSIPMILLIGWRGEPGVKDEPQHVKMGKVTPGILETLGVPYKVIDKDSSDFNDVVNWAKSESNKSMAPVAILVRKGTFAPYKYEKPKSESTLTREDAIETVVSSLRSEPLIVSTTGKLSRELYEVRLRRNEATDDFYNVGSMGHLSQIALGIAMARADKKVLCFDGDGAVLMHMGALPVIGSQAPKNLFHFVFNNCSYESVGGQPIPTDLLDFEGLARSCGYKSYHLFSDAGELENFVSKMDELEGPILVEIKINLFSRSDLGRPKTTPLENKLAFMEKFNGQADLL